MGVLLDGWVEPVSHRRDARRASRNPIKVEKGLRLPTHPPRLHRLPILAPLSYKHDVIFPITGWAKVAGEIESFPIFFRPPREETGSMQQAFPA
jgi:hypothetical protein